jgi:hypothetical protein
MCNDPCRFKKGLHISKNPFYSKTTRKKNRKEWHLRSQLWCNDPEIWRREIAYQLAAVKRLVTVS